MAKSKNHTAHNQSYKAHRRGIKKVKATKYQSTKGVRAAISHLTFLIPHTGPNCTSSDSLSDVTLQMDPKFLRNQVNRLCICCTYCCNLLRPVLPAVGLSVLSAHVSSADAEIRKEEEPCARWIIRNSIEPVVASSRFGSPTEVFRLVQSCNIEPLSHIQPLCRLLWYCCAV